MGRRGMIWHGPNLKRDEKNALPVLQSPKSKKRCPQGSLELAKHIFPNRNIPWVILAVTNFVTRHKFRVWDAVILAAASSDCLLLSEDPHEGFIWLKQS